MKSTISGFGENNSIAETSGDSLSRNDCPWRWRNNFELPTEPARHVLSEADGMGVPDGDLPP